MDQPSSGAGRHGAVSELPDARRSAEPGRASHHAVVQCHSLAARLVGVCHQVCRLSGEARRRRASHVLMLSSGFAAMGYEIVWTQQSSLWLGHESAAVLAVVAAFFGGLAVGGLALGPRIEASARPVHWYAGCELAVALWSAILLVIASPFSGGVLRTIGVQPSAGWQWLVAFCSTFLLFLPATAAMGATLPAMERITAQLREQRRSIAALYASNTFGSVLGVLAAAFCLIPAIGLARSAAISIALNLLCCVVALAVFPRALESAP